MFPNRIPLPEAPARRPLAVLDVARGEEESQDSHRLSELGVLPGRMVTLIRTSPFGCPLEIEIEGARFAVRRETAMKIFVDAGVAS